MPINLSGHWADIAALVIVLAAFCLDVRFGLRFERQKEQQHAD